ncbi:hypothetical protein [Seongchinamella sediminis]|nr:hypothetical protein [Seongchinamella sediminis]
MATNTPRQGAASALAEVQEALCDHRIGVDASAAGEYYARS